jgi:YVTN family beta-propeller protein
MSARLTLSALLATALVALPLHASAETGVTDGPKGAVANPKNGKAYIAFPDYGFVKILHGDSVKILKTGVNVKDLTLDPASGKVYAMNRGPGTISVIDPVSDEVSATIPANRGSLTALNPRTGKLYVSASTGTDPSVIDLATGVTTVIHAGTEGNALSVNPQKNEIYFVGYEDNFLTIVDGATLTPRRLPVPGWHQWDSAFSEKTGQLYLPSPNDNAVMVIDTRDGDRVSVIGTGKSPVAVAVDRTTNRVYVANYESSDVTVIDAGTNRAVATVPVGLWPQQLAVNEKTGRVYVANTHAGSVSVLDGKTAKVIATVPAGDGPWALAVDPVANKIYVANRAGGGTVTVIDGRTNKAVQR